MLCFNVGIAMPIYRTKNEDFFKTWSSDMAYLLGFFAADGNMVCNGRGGYYISFEITDLDLLESIKSVLGSQNKISVRNRKSSWKTIYRLQIGSKNMYRDLCLLGFTPHKSLTIAWPDIPTIYLHDFIRGYFDGDGCVHLGRYWRKDRCMWKLQFSVRFTSGSRKFLESLWSAIEPVVLGGHISRKKRGYELVFGQHDSIALFNFLYNNDTELFLKRKHEKFKYAFQELGLDNAVVA